MKREFTFFVLLALIAVSCNSQTERFYLSCPDNQHPHLIDLGLTSGTKWACCNVGASAPEECGGYYAWGETEEKKVYNWSTYIHCDGTEDTCHDIGTNIGGTKYDAAHVRWGGNWKMPSWNQFKELVNECSHEWTEINGRMGLKFIGQNGHCIYFPTTGFCHDSDKSFPSQEKTINAAYWSCSTVKTVDEEYIPLAAEFQFGMSIREAKISCIGIPIRAVTQ